MHTPVRAIEAYLLAKDANRPHLMEQAFTADATLRMEVRSGAIAFPPLSSGREAIAEVLVRRFGQTYENVYTFCLAPPPAPGTASFNCGWLVAMSDKQDRGVRIGCGGYGWRFDAASGLVRELSIRIDAMVPLSPAALPAVMRWVTCLPSPWCDVRQVFSSAPALDGLAPVLDRLATGELHDFAAVPDVA